MEHGEKLLVKEAVAAMLGYSQRHFMRLVDAGKVPKPVRIRQNAHPRWRQSEIDAYLAQIGGGLKS